MLKIILISGLFAVITGCGSSGEKTTAKTDQPIGSEHKIKAPLELRVDYPKSLERGKNYQAKINFKANRDLEITDISYTHPKSYRGTVPASGRISQRLKSDEKFDNTIPFSVQDNMKDGYLVITVSYLLNDQVLTTSSSVRLFADEFLPKTQDLNIKEDDGSTTSLKVYQQ